MKYPPSAILYQNEEKTITLIDIPASITLAQVIPGQTPTRILLSTPPREEPYQSIEPKSEKARAHVIDRMGSGNETCHYADLTREGLLKVKQNYHSDWCLPRHLLPFTPGRQGKKRKRGVGDSTDGARKPIEEPDLKLMSVKSVESRDEGRTEAFPDPRPSVATQTENLVGETSYQVVYHIPCQAAAVIGSITDDGAAYFRRNLPTVYPNPSFSAGPSQFDFILLDPPWQSKSVSRSKRYQTVRDDDPIAIVSKTLSNYLSPKALVGCWITNNTHTRMMALTRFFDAWDVELIEAWIWVKTTVHGEPVYEIEGLWRKPYEVLLLGRKRSAQKPDQNHAEKNRVCTAKQRLIVGVPDLHSRKPSLKELIGPMMPDPKNYRALEVFARNMTSGWSAWGDEAM
jgi:N6-adenosine-specific RNA methylase IME4